MDKITKYKLKIVSGIHRSAEIIIWANEKYVIGSGDDCDIILTDPGVEKNHLELHVTDGKINVIENFDESVFIDGCMISGESKIIDEYQVVAMGEAQFAVGDCDANWPPLKPIGLINGNNVNESSKYLPMIVPQRDDSKKSRITQNLINLIRAILKIEKRITIGIGVFLFVFFIFWADFIQSGTREVSYMSNGSCNNLKERIYNRSLVSSINSILGQFKDNGLIGAGVKEPYLNIDEEKDANIDPLRKTKEYLKSRWGDALDEIITVDKGIGYQGKNNADQINLDIVIREDTEGMYTADGFTLTTEQRRQFMTELGDIIRVKISSAEDIVGFCRKVMKKTKIEDPNAHFDIYKRTATIEGKAFDLDDISNLEKILKKTIPDISIINRIRYAPEGLNIIGVNSSGVEYVKLIDGSKIFKGGTLDNGCIIEDILSNDVELNCQGTKVIYKLEEET